jgi:hypothetical protein
LPQPVDGDRLNLGEESICGSSHGEGGKFNI